MGMKIILRLAFGIVLLTGLAANAADSPSAPEPSPGDEGALASPLVPTIDDPAAEPLFLSPENGCSYGICSDLDGTFCSTPGWTRLCWNEEYEICGGCYCQANCTWNCN